jgi:glycosyltransferase involved in cell wall biosynthesis
VVSVLKMSTTPETEHLVLILAYHYPPENEIGGTRPYRFAKYLSRLGYTCRVFTAADQAGSDDTNVEYVPDPFVTRPRHSLSWQLERAARKFILPGDVGMHWSYRASQAARACIRAHSGARVTIFSTFPPLGAHLAGWQLVRGNRLAWIADFRDPTRNEWANEPITPFQRRVNRWLERAVARRANAIIANTDAALVRWQEKFPSYSNKFHLIWNGFDPEERIKPLPVLLQDCKILSHIGDLYSRRNATQILESVARLIAAKRFPKGTVRVRLIGSAHSDCLPSPDFIRRGNAEGWLDVVTKRIPQQEALQVAQLSTGLLLLQPQSSTQVPGKLFEYLQIGRPILAFIQPNSPAERLLERSGVPYRCVYPGSTPEAMDDAVASFFELPSTAVAPNLWFEENFNAERQTRVLDSIIRSVHGAQPSRKRTVSVSMGGATICDTCSLKGGKVT